MSALTDVLASTPQELARLVQRGGEEALDTEPDGEWSIRTTLAHLRDEEGLVFRLRLERMLSEAEPEFLPFPPERWLETRKRDRDDTRTVLQDFALQRKASVNLLERIRPEDWERSGKHPRGTTHTVASWVEYWVSHDREHLGAIEQNLESLSK
ncbi:MAG: DinB family protein [Dehalococcoidia bacterium]|nr:DinB family protein [Dehalococcoidia bacterium]